MSETLGEHKAPFLKIDNQFEVSYPDWEPGKPTQMLQKKKKIHLSTRISHVEISGRKKAEI